jgi:TRAP transporter TAXI family solute receptor
MASILKKTVTTCFLLLIVASISVLVFAKPCEADKVKVTILAHKLGSTSYVLSFALADIINANSTKIQATAIETKGTLSNLLEWQTYDQDKQKYVISYCPPMYMHLAAVGDKPFKKPFKAPKLIARNATYTNPILTRNPKIKTGKDLAGRRVSFAFPGSAMEMAFQETVKAAWNLKVKDYKNTPMGFSGAADALIDGTLDVALQGAGVTGTTEEWQGWVPNPALEKLLSSSKCSIIDLPEEAIAKAREATGYPIYPIKNEAQTVGKSKLPRFTSIISAGAWAVSDKMPDDLVEEICRVIFENAGKFADYHAQGKYITPDTLTRYAKSYFHPVAIQFYEKKGKTFLD